MSLQNPSNWLPSGTGSGVVVNDRTSESISAVVGCMRLLAESMMMLPRSVMQQEGSQYRVATEHPVHDLIHNRPNPNYSGSSFVETMMLFACSTGAGVAYIERDTTERPVRLHLLDPRQIGRQLVRGELRYTVPGMPGLIDPMDMIDVQMMSRDGICGSSILRLAGEVIGQALSAQAAGSKYYADGDNRPGYWGTDQVLDKNQTTRIQESIAATWNSNSGHPFIPGGFKFQPFAIDPSKSLLLEAQKHSAEEIARFFGVPAHMIGLLDRATFNNIEVMSTQFVIYTLGPWIKRFEDELTYKLLYEQERKDGYYIKFNEKGLLRGDLKSQTEYLKTMLANGVLNRNEVRALDDRNPIKGGDIYTVQVNQTSIDNLPNLDENKPNDAE